MSYGPTTQPVPATGTVLGAVSKKTLRFLLDAMGLVDAPVEDFPAAGQLARAELLAVLGITEAQFAALLINVYPSGDDLVIDHLIDPDTRFALGASTGGGTTPARTDYGTFYLWADPSGSAWGALPAAPENEPYENPQQIALPTWAGQQYIYFAYRNVAPVAHTISINGFGQTQAFQQIASAQDYGGNEYFVYRTRTTQDGAGASGAVLKVER